ncbi:unnamed protein product, partial [Ilex paraguariensis]
SFVGLNRSLAAQVSMNMSRPAVHPVEAPPMTDGANNPLRVRMKNVQGMPGTPGGLALRLCQFAFAVVSLCIMASTSDFPSVTAFWYYVLTLIAMHISIIFLHMYRDKHFCVCVAPVNQAFERWNSVISYLSARTIRTEKMKEN